MSDTLDRLNELCLSLPEAEVEYANTHAGYTVRGKRFAWYLNNHHGDEIVALSVREPPGANRTLVEMDPERYFLPAYMAHHGWVALRLDLGEIDWAEVATLVLDSYRLQAPKRLSAHLAQGLRALSSSSCDDTHTACSGETPEPPPPRSRRGGLRG